MVAIRDIAYVRYAAPELDSMEKFLVDFGLVTAKRTARKLYMRGYGESPHLHITELAAHCRTIGFGVHLHTMQDLSALSSQFNVPIEEVMEPGGGSRIQLTDPSGFIIDFIQGQMPCERLAHRQSIDVNTAMKRTRAGRSVRVKIGPSHVMRLGHVVLLVKDFRKSFEFYRDVLGLRPADSYFAGTRDNVVASFMRCGLGSTFTDHHTIALVAAADGVSRFDHCAFEVLDLDDVMHGNAHLRAKGYSHSWGVGRHIQGSQIFDYWRDPHGNKIEHWTDGDLVNDFSPVGLSAMSGDELKQWAPPLNPEFFS